MASKQEELLERILRALEQSARTGAAGAAGGPGVGPRQPLAAREQQSFLSDVRDRLASSVGIGNGLRGLGVNLAAAAPLAAAGAVGAFLGGGLVAEARGGNFAHGVQRTALNALAAIPIVGDLTGARGARDVLRGTEGDLNALTNQVARFGGARAITPEVRAFLADQFVQQNKNLEEDRRLNEAAVNKRIGSVDGEGKLSDFMSALGEAAGRIRGLFGGGAGQHT